MSDYWCPCLVIASKRRVYLGQQIFAVTEATANLFLLNLVEDLSCAV